MPARHRLLSSVLSLAFLCLVPLFISPRTLSAQSNTEEKERVPTESYEDYVARIHARCGLRWQTCSATCNVSVDPVARSVCIGDYNNDLYNCNYGF